MSAELQTIYSKIPEVHCKGLCQGACGPIGMSQMEAQAIRDRVGDRFRFINDGESVFLVGKSLTCPALDEKGKCSVYSDRPAVCRLWGAVKEMQCPHGCRPKKWLKDEDSRAILRAVRAVSQEAA